MITSKEAVRAVQWLEQDYTARDNHTPDSSGRPRNWRMPPYRNPDGTPRHDAVDRNVYRSGFYQERDDVWFPCGELREDPEPDEPTYIECWCFSSAPKYICSLEWTAQDEQSYMETGDSYGDYEKLQRHMRAVHPYLYDENGDEDDLPNNITWWMEED